MVNGKKLSFVTVLQIGKMLGRHEMSKYPVDAVQVLRKPQRDVGEMLSQCLSRHKKLNSHMLLVIVQTLQFLTRQALAVRGHDDGKSIFIQLLKLRSCDQ